MIYHGLNPVSLLRQINGKLERQWALPEYPGQQQRKFKTHDASVTTIYRTSGEEFYKVTESSFDLAELEVSCYGGSGHVTRQDHLKLRVIQLPCSFWSDGKRMKVRWTPSLGQDRGSIKSGSRCPLGTWYQGFYQSFTGCCQA